MSIHVRTTADGSIVASSSSASIDIPTTAGSIYVVERCANLLFTCTKAHIGGTANSGAKHLSDTICTLGM